MLDPVGFEDQVEAHQQGIDGVPVSGLLCKLNTVIGKNGMVLVGRGLEQVLTELSNGASDNRFSDLGGRELGCTVDGDKHAEHALGSLHLGDADVKGSNRVALELLSASACRVQHLVCARCHVGAGTNEALILSGST